MTRARPKRYSSLAGLLIAAFVIASIWIPILSHYRILPAALSPDHVSSARQHPPDDILREIGSLKHNLVPPIGPDHEDAVAVARDLILDSERAGRSSLFNPDLLTSLDYAGFETPRVLLAAYEQSNDRLFLGTATRFLVDFARYEESAWLPDGLMWNDHAVGVRPVALGEFWRHYRDSPEYDDATARTLLEHVTGTAARLADPRHYTFVSNHGTMQNLGLLHLALAFPGLPGMQTYAELAIERQREQMAYIFGPEGAWRENSIGYHRLGMELTGIFLRYMTLAGVEIPPDMRRTYESAYEYYGLVRAADGSLPAIGDTSHSTRQQEPLTTTFDPSGRTLPLTRSEPDAAAVRQRLFADLGQVLWWSGDEHEAQTVITWSNFKRHGHNHADELSLNLRSRDGRWWTSVGYWPLHDELRMQAQSWSGSNAPHLAGESEHSVRTSELLGYAWSDDLAAVDLKRSGPGPFAAQRQIIYVKPSTWLVIDAFDDKPAREARIVWGVDHDVEAAPGPHDDSFRLARQASPASMSVQILRSGGLAPRVMNGSLEPFAGWVELNYRAVASDAIVLEVPSASAWTAVVSRLEHGPGTRATGPLRMLAWSGADNWHLELPEGSATVNVRREGQTIAAARRGERFKLELSGPPDPSPAVARGDQVFAAATARYGGHFADILTFRSKVTLLLLVLLFGHLAVLYLLRRFSPAYESVLGAAAAVCWLLTGSWLHVAYPLGLL